MPVRETPFRGAWQRDGIQARRLRAIAKRSFAEGVPKPDGVWEPGYSLSTQDSALRTWYGHRARLLGRQPDQLQLFVHASHYFFGQWRESLVRGDLLPVVRDPLE